MSKTRNWKEVTLEDGVIWDKQKPVEGVLTNTENEVGPNNSKMYTIKTEDDEIKVWGSTVLDDKLAHVVKGTFVKIEYEGKLKSKKGTEYHSYKVFVDEDSAPDETVEEIIDNSEPIDISKIPF